MNRRWRIPLVAVLLTGALLGWGSVWAQATYTITRYTVASSGQSGGGGYAVRATAGQAPVNTLSGGPFIVSGGYWYPTRADDSVQVFLPAVQR